MNTSLVPVPFHGATLFLIEQNNEPYTPMKPIVEGMGLTWHGQFEKLNRNQERWGIRVTRIPSESGEQETLCIPLRKLPGWLMTIHPSRVKPELREKILRYQNECDDVLWEYWTKGRAANPRVETLSPARGIGAVEKTVDKTADLGSARRTLDYLERWGQDLPEPARMSFLEAVQDLKTVVVKEWTEVDEAIMRISTGLALLRRFRGLGRS